MSGVKYHKQWENIIDSFFKYNGFVKHQIESYDDFIETGIQRILNELGPIEIKTNSESRGGESIYNINFGKISIKKPVIREHDGTTNILYPQEARNRNLTYHSSLYCDITVKTVKNNEIIEKVCKEQLGFIPIMVKSKFCLLNGKTEQELKDIGECIYDEGGYFIINGNEKAVVAQERMPNNVVFCFYKKPPSKIIWQAEIRSNFEYHIKTTSTFYIRLISKGIRNTYNNSTFTDIDGMRGQITYIKQDIPIIFIFYSLGFVSKNEIIDIIVNSRIYLDDKNNDEYFKTIIKFLRCSFDEADDIIRDEFPNINQAELQNFCLDYIGKRGSLVYPTKEERIEYSIQILNKELLPHLSTDYSKIFNNRLILCKEKAYYIGYMINKLYLCYTGVNIEDDRDHLANKRVDLTGTLLTSLFKNIFKRLYKEAKSNLTKSIEANNNFDLMNNIKSKSITNDIKYALSTGNWGRQVGGTPPKSGVAQQLNRLSYSSSLSHLRRLNTPLNREGKQAKPRQLHNTHWGYLCLHKDTTVLLDNGDLMSLDNLSKFNKNSSIYVVDPITRKSTISKIAAFQNFDTLDYPYKKILKITTRSGRSIIATEDHRFAVYGGDFKESGKIGINDKLLIMPTPTETLQNKMPVKIIMDKKTFINRTKNCISMKTLLTEVDELEKNGLLPLSNEDKRVNILASLIGYNMTDGHIDKKGYSYFYMGSKEDADNMRSESLLLNVGKITEPVKKNTKYTDIITKRETHYETWNVNISGSLSRLLVALGAVIGKKTDKIYNVPEFIKDCDKKIKSSYLSALFGGDGSSLTYRQDISKTKNIWRVNAPYFCASKKKTMTDNIESYLTDIKNLLKEFDIETSDIYDPSGTDDKKRVKLSEDIENDPVIERNFLLAKSYTNLLQFSNNIGFKWCKQKQNKMKITSEYLRYCKETIRTTYNNKKLAIELHNSGKFSTEISKQIGINKRIVESWIFRKNTTLNKTNLPENTIKWDEYINDTNADIITGTLYDKVCKIEEISEDECPVVMDLTTVSDIHTFVSNGFVTHNCPAETPEGQGCGLLKNFAITCHISIGSETTYNFLCNYLQDTFKENLINNIDLDEENLYKLFIDGAWILSLNEKDSVATIRKLREFRRKLVISYDTCILKNNKSNEVHIYTVAGRCCRPLLITSGLHLLENPEYTENMTWIKLISSGIVEYIDISEEEELMISMNLDQFEKDPEKYTHMEIHPSVILGVCASIIPFPDHNQSPRNIYQSAMGKQAMGIYLSNYNERFDTLAHVLHNPQKPLVTTTAMKYVKSKELPSGINAIVAIGCYGGFNQEDSIIFNKGALDRGLFRSTFFRTYVDQEKEIIRVGGLMEQFEIPDKSDTKGIQHGNYGKLDTDGIIEPGSRTEENDIIIGKTTPIATSKQEISQMKKFKKRDVSTSMRPNEVGVIDKVIITTNSDGYKYTKVKVRSIRIPEIGDKFSSRHGQKGTIGMIYRHEDMPFTADGIVPDIIINPHAIPSRMTIGHLIECLLGKVAVMSGKEGNATPFSGLKIDEISKALEEFGYSGDGTETMYNGETGEEFPTKIFIGPTYYQRLKHMVADKEHSRSSGPVTKLTRQPLEGRSKEGGLRFGEMERDAVIAHGASNMLKDRMFYNSDPYRIHVCKLCGTICQSDLDKQRFLCKCVEGGNTTEIAQVFIPYACKLFFQELMAMSIIPRIKV
jgi:DNA-directed RNA polymerase beta subunit/intein/homing endonuclease